MKPFAWHGCHKNDQPGQKPLIFTSETEAKEWVKQYKPGWAWLEPLYKGK